MLRNQTTRDLPARRLAHRAGFRARKSRSRNVLVNRGGYMLVDAGSKISGAGFNYDLSGKG
jgi:hypothetical protein